MKYSELIRKLERSKCYVVRHGGRHDVWYSPITGKTQLVPRHGSHEVANGTAIRILKDMLGE